MTPEELQGLLTSMARAAEVVEAIDEPALQTQRGWNLAGWTYEMVPWGVRFHYRGRQGEDRSAILVVAFRRKQGPDLSQEWASHSCPTMILMLP